MKIGGKFRRVAALVALAVLLANTVLPVSVIAYTMDDAVHYEENGDATGDGTGEGDGTEGDTTGDGTEEGDGTEGGATGDGTGEGDGTEGDTTGDDTDEGDGTGDNTTGGAIVEDAVTGGAIVEETTEAAFFLLFDLAEGDTDWYTGVLAEDPGAKLFQIGTEEELRGFAYLVNSATDDFSGKTIQLTGDITLDGEWTPIGLYDLDTYEYAPFSGTFDGGTHTISGLQITEPGKCKGLFGAVYSGKIQNLTVSGEITQMDPASSGYLGGIVGMAGETDIEDCDSNVNITVTKPEGIVSFIGGIAGNFTMGGNVKYCTNGGIISIADPLETVNSVGGIVGGTEYSAMTLEFCKNVGDISITNPQEASQAIGGIVGGGFYYGSWYTEGFAGGTLTSCTNDGRISIEGGSIDVNQVGGIVGWISKSTTMDYCGNYGEISRTGTNGAHIGGLVGGVSDPAPLAINNSYNSGKIISSSISASNHTGGLVGKGGGQLTIFNSRNLSSVNSSSSYTGGLVGSATGKPVIRESCNKGNVTVTGDQSTSYIGGIAGILGKVGDTVTVALENVYNEGNVSVDSTGTASNYTGGVAGYIAAGVPRSTDISIKECYNTGPIIGGNYTGGVFGYLGVELGNISHCYNTGDVATNGESTDGIILGGMAGDVGSKTSLSHCYNVGGITSTEATVTAIGGITGRNGASDSYVSSSFSIGKITAEEGANVGGVTGSNYAGNKNVYYDNSINTDTADAGAAGTKGVSPEAVKNGELTYLLDEGGKGYFRTTQWGQGDEYPVFADDKHKLVYRVKLAELADDARIDIDKEYVAGGVSVTLTITPPEGKILSLVTVVGARAGKQLVGIVDDESAVKVVTFTMPGEDVTVTATFIEKPADEQYTVTYHANDGSEPEKTAVRQVEAGKRAENYTPDFFGFTSPEDSTFDYWSLEDGGSGNPEAPAEYDFNTAVVKDIKLYAIWRASDTHRVTFNLSGSTGIPPAVQFVPDGEKVVKPEDPTWESGDDIEKYAFDQWCDKDGKPWDFDKDTVETDMTLYAKWKMGNVFALSSEEHPVEISSEGILRQLAVLINNGQITGPVYVKLGANIDLKGEWTPIGTEEALAFKGVFDGGIYTISGLEVTGGKYAGLFGYVKGYQKDSEEKATVLKNITVEGSVNASLSGGAWQAFAGGIAGYASGVIFEGCANEAPVTAPSYSYAGGIVGQGTNITLKNCENSGTIGDKDSNISDIGGIAGSVSLTTAAENLVNHGDIGSTYKDDSGNAVGTARNAGGIFGSLTGSKGISKSYNTGAVTASETAGGIVAAYESDAPVEVCYNLGDVSVYAAYPMPTDPYKVGGIVGSKNANTKIKSCYSMGNLKAKVYAETANETDAISKVGGIVGTGFNVGILTIEGCCFLKSDTDTKTYIDEGLNRSVSLSRAAFESGEAAWRLDQGDKTARTQNWSQDLVHKRPMFAAEFSRPVYRMSVNAAADGKGRIEPQGISYPCESSTVTLAITPDPEFVLKSLAITDSKGKKYSANRIEANEAVFTMPAANITVTPEFMDKNLIDGGPFTVSFDLNYEGAGIIPSQTVTAGAMVTQPADPERSGYLFMGWYDDEDLKNVVDGRTRNFLACESFNFNTVILKPMTLVACWKADNDVIVSFDLNRADGAKGSGPVPSQIVSDGGKIQRPGNDPTWTLDSRLFQMKFKNWSEDMSDPWDFDNKVISAADYPDCILTLYAQWDKTVTDNPEITDGTELEELALIVNSTKISEGYDGFKNVDFKLVNDIQLGPSWVGLGKYSESNNFPFNGNFLGGGNTVTLDPSQTQPLFGYLGEYGKVTNLVVTGMKISPSSDNFGGIAGVSGGTIKDCDVTLTIRSNNRSSIGGFVGKAIGGIIERCALSNSSEITGWKGVGGIAGVADGADITGCETEEGAKIIGNRQVGGIVGTLWHIVGPTHITGCINNADIGTDANAAADSGGIAGCASYTETGTSLCKHPLTIEDCENYGNIIGNRYVGGIVGHMGTGSDRMITDCVNYGEVTIMLAGGGVGGIIGQASLPSGHDGTFNLKIGLQGCENYGNITSKIHSTRIGGLVGSLLQGIGLTVEGCKVGDLEKEAPVTMGGASGFGNTYTVGGLIGGVTLLSSTSTNVLVSDCSFYGALNGDQVAVANNGALGGVIGIIEGSASTSGTTERSVTIDKVGVAVTMNGNSAAVGGAIGKLNGADPMAVYTLKNISVEGNLPNTGTTTIAGNGGLGGLIGQAASFAGTLNINGSSWKGSFTDGTPLPHGGMIGDLGEIAATGEVNIADVYMQGDFGGTPASTGGVIGNITKLNGGVVNLKNTYWYGNGIHPVDGQAGGMIGQTGENSGTLEVKNSYYGFRTGNEPVEINGGTSNNGIFKSRLAFQEGEVAWLLDGGEETHNNIWTQDSSLKLPVLGEGSVYRVSITTDDSGASVRPDKIYAKVGATFQVSATKASKTVTENGQRYKITYTPVFTVTEGSMDFSDGQGSLTVAGNGEITVTFTETKELVKTPPPTPTPGKGGEGEGTGDGAGNVGGGGDGAAAGVTEGEGQSEQGASGNLNNASNQSSPSEDRADYLKTEGATAPEEAPPTEEPEEEKLPEAPEQEAPAPIVEEEPEHEGILSTAQKALIAVGAIGGLAAVGVGIAAATGAIGAGAAGAGAAGTAGAGSGKAASGIGKFLKWLKR